MNKILKLLILSVFIVLFLTGCVQARFHITVNRDGSADLEYKIGLDSTLSAMSGENLFLDIEESARKEDFTITQYNEDGFTGIIARKHIKNIENITNEYSGMFTTNQNNEKNPFTTLNFKVDKGFFYNTYKVNGYIDLQDVMQNDAVQNQGDNDISKQMVQVFLSRAKVDLVLTLPVKPLIDNATSKTDSGKTLTWDLILGKKNDILLEVRVWNIINIIATIVAVIVLASGLIVFPSRK